MSNSITRERHLEGNFHEIQVSVIPVKVEVGPAFDGLSVSAEPEVVTLIETVIVGRTLVIRPHEGASFSTSVPIEVRLNSESLSRVDVSAGARVELEGYFQEAIELHAASGAQINLSGQGTSVSAFAESGGRINLQNLRANQVSSNSTSGGSILS